MYKTFFRDYTEKVWGVHCSKIPAEWGAQRVKQLSIIESLKHALKNLLYKNKTKSIKQKDVITTLISQFIYPKHGPGSLWEEVGRIIESKGGKIIFNSNVNYIKLEQNNVKEIKFFDSISKKIETIYGDYFISTMPIKDLIYSMDSKLVPSNVFNISQKLKHRAFITVGLLLNKLSLKNKTKQNTLNNIIPDTWIYIQEKRVKVGRVQIFNNWSPYLIKDKSKVWIGLEYFCEENDELWSMKDEKIIEFAINEMIDIEFINRKEVVDSTIIKVPNTYPSYFGEAYKQFDSIRKFTDTIENLFLIGRGGMHRYDGMDHPMLTAMEAVKNIKNKSTLKENIWNINTEQVYHEEKQ